MSSIDSNLNGLSEVKHEASDGGAGEFGDDDEGVEKDGGGESLAIVVAKGRTVDQSQPSHLS